MCSSSSSEWILSVTLRDPRELTLGVGSLLLRLRLQRRLTDGLILSLLPILSLQHSTLMSSSAPTETAAATACAAETVGVRALLPLQLNAARLKLTACLMWHSLQHCSSFRIHDDDDERVLERERDCMQ